jgi:hypothetical protein
MRLRAGCAANIDLCGHDAAPSEAVVPAVSFINCRRLIIDDRTCSFGLFVFSAIRFPFTVAKIRPQPFNRRTVVCQSIQHPLRKLYKVLSDHGAPESRLSSVA